MNIFVATDGTIRCLYGEAIDLTALGEISIRRASRVEPDRDGCWRADLTPARLLNGDRAFLGPFKRRADALAAEAAALEAALACGAPQLISDEGGDS